MFAATPLQDEKIISDLYNLLNMSSSGRMWQAEILRWRMWFGLYSFQSWSLYRLAALNCVCYYYNL
jgi:hypothetical protein